MNYVTAKDIKERFKISGVTLMNWKNSGKLRFKRLSSKKILYDADSFNREDDNTPFNLKNVLYARVSTQGQKNDLDTQIDIIKKYMISNGVVVDEVYSDIASGMNENRKQFSKLMESVFRHEVKTVYITFKDRLSRFGFNYFKQIFGFFGTNIVVLDDNEQTSKSYQQELMEDLLALIHSYSMKLYTNRKKKLKAIENIIKENDETEK